MPSFFAIYLHIENASLSLHFGNYNTGYEIFSDLNGKIDVLIASVSTGDHLSGVSKYLKQHCIKKPIVVGFTTMYAISVYHH
jgi:cysteine synthase